MNARRWRPSLGLVLGGGLAGTLVLSLAGLVVFRYLGPAIGYQNAAILLGLIIAAATAFLGWLLVRLLLRPIHALQSYAAQVQADPQADTPPPGHFGTHELHATAQSVMEMAGVLRDREQSLRSYSDHVTHEIKTPVAGIRAAVELLEDGGALAAEDRALVDQISGAGRQIEGQLDALRQAARAREVRYVGVSSVGAALEAAELSAEVSEADRSAELPLSLPGLRVVLEQLIGNARAQGAGQVTLSVMERAGARVLRVTDDGPGISDGNRARIFEPFFTTRREADGTGMGLFIVQTLLRAHGADIALCPSGTGAVFEITFRV
ncbi:sensor histidine kinase [Pacificoceanicola onchidii]|uniref:sensor histidine kinase n=1 Tax=Pacificoceanicola onchidii TaxID=2562685 RepID=UPI0010A3C232|nr:HAMP domain-containing sensor histidine kinase [Pacificoceanicola onchidii]